MEITINAGTLWGYPKRLWDFTNKHYLWTAFILTVVADFWANWYSYAINHDWIILQAFLGFALPFINFPAMLYLRYINPSPVIEQRGGETIDYKSNWKVLNGNR